jgi:chaperonin GroEL
MRWIIANAGFKPSPILAQLAEKPDGWGFDVLAGEIRDMASAGILDPHRVVCTALTTGVSGALMAMTTDALVLHKKPDWQAEP